MLPNFMVVGAQKSGTTSLHHYLKGHPDIYLPAGKETKFFARTDRYEKGIEFYEREYFSEYNDEKAVGEVDPDYMFYEEALDRIGQHIPVGGLRFIFLLRNPVERAFSHYLMTYRRGEETLNFSEAIRSEEKRATGDYYSRSRYSYVTRGLYYPQIERFLHRVGRENVLILLTEDLKQDPVGVMKRCFQFLNVDVDVVLPELNQHYHGAYLPKSVKLVRLLTGENKFKKIARKIMPVDSVRSWLRGAVLKWNTSSDDIPTLNQADREFMSDIFRPYNLKLASLIERDLQNWR